MRLDHPDVGELALYREKLAITGTDGQVLVIYHPEPGTENAGKLAILGSYALPSSDGAEHVSTTTPS